MNRFNILTEIKTEEDKKLAFEQYKEIINTINQLNTVRELSNPFWSTINGVTITSVSFIKTLSEITFLSKPFLAVFLLTAGYLFCACWISYLITINKNIELRYEVLLELEKLFPVKYIHHVYALLHKRGKWLSLSFKELLVPCIFISAYSCFLISLILYPKD